MIDLDWKAVAAAGGVLLVVLYLAKKQAAAAAQAVGAAVNPVSDQNIFYKAASGVGNAVSQDGQSVPFGVRIYDFLHGGK